MTVRGLVVALNTKEQIFPTKTIIETMSKVEYLSIRV